MLMEKMASDIALAAELKLYKIAAEGEKEIKKPKAPKVPKAPAPAKAPKAAQPPKSNGGVKPPMSAGDEKGLRTNMMKNLNDIHRSNLPRYMGAAAVGAGMVPPGIRGYAGSASALSADPLDGIRHVAENSSMLGNDALTEKLLGDFVNRVPRSASDGDNINLALNNALTNQYENNYRNNLKNLLGFDF